jgi:hypothetical protein
MSSAGNTISRKEPTLIAKRLRRLRSPSPHRLNQRMSHAELAEAVNEAMKRLFPDRDLGREGLLVTERWVGEVIRGKSRWPGEERRRGLMEVFGVDHPREIGLAPSRPTDGLEDTGEGTNDHGEEPAATASFSWPPATAEPAVTDGVGTRFSTAASRLDVHKTHPARRYNYWLGGKNHFAADRESGDLIAAAWPAVVTAARENRAFLRRSVTCLAADFGIRQFLDIGCGLPVPGENTHELAQRVAAGSRVVYVDNDPMVSTHAQALLCGDPGGRTGYVEADIRQPAGLLRHPALRAVLDLDQPVGLLLVAVLHFIHDDEDAIGIVRQLLQALPSGSYVAISHGSMDFSSPAERVQYEQMFAAGQTDVRARSEEQITDFFTGMQLIEPGLVPAPQWRPDRPSSELPQPDQVAIYGGVGWVP